jgi:hypothetical protein
MVMPGLDDAVPLAARIEAEAPALSRRLVLRGAAGAGAAGIAAAAFAGSALPAAAGTRVAAGPARGAGTAGGGGSEPVVVHVRDAATGEMDVFRGTTHTRVRDRELAARLVHASS